MKPFELAESFLEQHGRKVSLPELKHHFQSSLSLLGIRYFICCQHGDPLSARAAPLVFQNYPPQWVREFSESAFHRIDPIFRFAAERILPFRWDDPEFLAALTPARRDVLMRAAAHGIVNGYTVPIHPPGGPAASCSVVPDTGAVIDSGVAQAVFSMACVMFDAMLRSNTESIVMRTLQLSERERQCLELAAQGKDDWTIGLLLRISERTAHNHIERAKRRLGVCTRVQVIVHALNDGQISFDDVIRVETQPRPERELRKRAN